MTISIFDAYMLEYEEWRSPHGPMDWSDVALPFRNAETCNLMS